jgi:hypothetical protein
MPEHDERPANALARGPAKPDDIERARRDVDATASTDAAKEVRAAAETLRSERADLRPPADPR